MYFINWQIITCDVSLLHVLEKYNKNEYVKVFTTPTYEVLNIFTKKKNVLGEGIVSGSGTVPAIVLKLRTKHYLRKRFHNVFILKLWDVLIISQNALLIKELNYPKFTFKDLN